MTSTVEFKLFAPRNQGAALIGSFLTGNKFQWKKMKRLF